MTRIEEKMERVPNEVITSSGHHYAMLNYPLKAPLTDGDVVVVQDKRCIVVSAYGDMATYNDADVFMVMAPLILLKDIWAFSTTNKRDYTDLGFRLKKSTNKFGLLIHTWDRLDVDWRMYKF